MKKMMAKSLVVVFGASIFLYSEHALANTVIYDPLNPHNTITPIPNADPDPSEYLIDGEITMESAESTPSQDQKDNTNVENTQNNEVQSSTVQVESESVALLPTDELKQEEKDMIAAGTYTEKAQIDLATRYGKLMGYSDAHIAASIAGA